MRVTQLKRPLVAAASGITKATTTPTLRHVQDVFAQLRIGAGAANAAVEGRRYAAVKAQGAYRLRDSSTIPKKLGAKKSGGTSVLVQSIVARGFKGSFKGSKKERGLASEGHG